MTNKAVNNAVQARALNEPNPHTILSQIPAEAARFKVVDLSNTFFSFLVNPSASRTSATGCVKATVNLMLNAASEKLVLPAMSKGSGLF